MPTLKTASQKSESIQIGTNTGSSVLGGDGEETSTGGKWEDEEERRFFEEIPDIKDYVPRSVLGIEDDMEEGKDDGKEKERQEKERVEEEVRRLEEELAEMKIDAGGNVVVNGKGEEVGEDKDVDELVSSWFGIDTFALLTSRSVFQPPHLVRLKNHPRQRHNWHRKVPPSF